MGPGASAMLNGPAGVCCHAKTAAFVVAEWGHYIRLIAPDGHRYHACWKRASGGSTDGPGNTATFARPSGMDVLPNGKHRHR